ncbi:MAG: DNA primase, partial [Firmicutes bacterium]|nr:DNA primase [Bacillota bacterium]
MAARFDDNWIAEVRDATNIVDIIGQSVSLKRKGRHYWGLCPFHHEKTPSFSVDPDQQLFYCFGCHVGGTVFTFLTKLENRSFTEVVEDLAGRAGIALPDNAGQGLEASAENQRIRDVLSWTQMYFQEMLQQHRKIAEEYLLQRGMDENWRKHFEVGYAPDRWDGLVNYLKAHNVLPDEMVQAGVAVARQSGSGVYDRWRGRIMLPIWDQRGRIVGFGGRSVDPANEPKYLNSPETDVFQKGDLLYGMHWAQKVWRDRPPLLVEGYFDVIACHKAGLIQAVASLGTALTERQIRYLRRFNAQINLLYDQDAAGQEANRRAFLLLSQAGMKVNLITLENAKDPDEYLEKFGGQALAKKVAE